MNKLKVCVVYGGMSTEHDVSIASSKAIISNLDKNKYDISVVYISKDGKWYDNDELILNIQTYLSNVDVVFPVLHGMYGEDGTIQGLFEMFGVKYVGCGVLASSLGMDKVYSKIMFDRAGLKQAKYIYIKKVNDEFIYINDKFDEKRLTLDEISDIVLKKLEYPVFVKPSKSGSSIGLNKAHNSAELKEYIQYASDYDRKILIEENIVGREIECSVLGNNKIGVSNFGEIISADSFYSYDAKYNNNESRLVIPVKFDKKVESKLKKMAVKAYKSIDGCGLARVDFFVANDNIYINEVNTMPGFTNISMYPKLWESSGVSFSELLDKLIDLSLSN